MQTLKVIVASLAVYAMYLPVAIIAGSYHSPIESPAGTVIEKIGRMDLDKPDHYYSRLYIFGPARFPDTSRIAVYEDLKPLSDVNFTPDAGAYVVRIKASDGSDPRTNGRSYWVVAP